MSTHIYNSKSAHTLSLCNQFNSSYFLIVIFCKNIHRIFCSFSRRAVVVVRPLISFKLVASCITWYFLSNLRWPCIGGWTKGFGSGRICLATIPMASITSHLTEDNGRGVTMFRFWVRKLALRGNRLEMSCDRHLSPFNFRDLSSWPLRAQFNKNQEDKGPSTSLWALRQAEEGTNLPLQVRHLDRVFPCPTLLISSVEHIERNISITLPDTARWIS